MQNVTRDVRLNCEPQESGAGAVHRKGERGARRRQGSLLNSISIANDRESEQGASTGKGREPAAAKNEHNLIDFHFERIGIRSRGRPPERGESPPERETVTF